MKRLAIALAALGFSVGTFAALPAATDPTIVDVPQMPGGFFIGGTALYIQPHAASNELAYGYSVAAVPPPPVTSPFVNSRYFKVDPGYNWGWGIDAGYIFPNTANDVAISYFHIGADKTNSTVITPNSVTAPAFIPTVTPGFLPVFTIVPPSALPSGVIQNALGEFAPTATSFIGAKAEYDVNQVDVEAGQYIDVGCRLRLHPTVGLRWAEVERKLTTDALINFQGFSGSASALVISTSGASSALFTLTVTASFTDPASTNFIHDYEKSDFNGIGPMADLDASYYVGYGFGFVAHADTAVLIGTIDTKNDQVTTINNVGGFAVGTPFTSVSTWSEPSTRRIVPVTDLKLGADYTYLFNQDFFGVGANSDLTLEVGWQATKYFNSVDRTYATSAIVGGVDLANIDGRPTTTSNVGFQGPYVNLTFHA